MKYITAVLSGDVLKRKTLDYHPLFSLKGESHCLLQRSSLYVLPAADLGLLRGPHLLCRLCPA